jgi:heme/copper-type cytochrome/quinol oxidase subunit 2
MNFQVPATEVMEKIVDLHHDLMFFILLIIGFVSAVMAQIIKSFSVSQLLTYRVNFTHHTLLEKI